MQGAGVTLAIWGTWDIRAPHIAAFTAEAQARVVAAVRGDVRAVLEREPALYRANAPRRAAVPA